MPEMVVEMPTTVLTSAGMPTAQYGRQQLSFHRNLQKSCHKGEYFLKKDTKNCKNSHFYLKDFSQPDSYQTVGIPMFLVRYLKSKSYKSNILIFFS
jgi:hypothetical protein